MLKKGELVRCPIDFNEEYHRDFAIGKILSINYDDNLAIVDFFDTNNANEYYDKPEKTQYSLNQIRKARLNIHSKVIYNKEIMTVKACKLDKENNLYYYYIQDEFGLYHYVSEVDVFCGFSDGYVNPVNQMRCMEFQNPQWFFGRNIVSKAMNNINTSLYGFKILTGCKIILKPHQLRTVMRCVKNDSCRIMLADEVGMGKTIEALSILKVYLADKRDQKITIIVPASLKEQWITELCFKFKIFVGENTNNNFIEVLSFDEMNEKNLNSNFVIIDEVHRVLKNKTLYNRILNISLEIDNIIMLSATPLQKREDEYKKLLTLIQPSKYSSMSDDEFNKILDKQSTIVKRIFDLRDELSSYLEEIEDSNNQANEDMEEMYEEIIDEFKSINKIINDSFVKEKIDDIRFDTVDFGVYRIKQLISYICENYQLEKSIIRNRRTKEFEDEYNVRELIDCSYDIESSINETENKMYSSLSNWLSTLDMNVNQYVDYIIPLINSFFSSAKAFKAKLIELSNVFDVPNDLLVQTEVYSNSEDSQVDNIRELVNEIWENECKISKIVDFLEQECDESKTLVFTDFNETFELYRKIFIDYFGEDHCAFFNTNMDRDELESNVYKFQNKSKCKILLSDKSGGEGRNFQNADYLINIDLPWDANDLEQRIGRLDRIGRDENKNVTSVVFYARNSMEEDLFNVWHNGLKIFEKSQSGLEIIMQDITNNIIDNVKKDFKFGLSIAIDEVLKLVDIQLGELKKERMFDISAYEYKNLNISLEKTLDTFHRNEKSIFSDAMLGWASLTGFRASRDSENVVTFSKNSISFKSLQNTLFIPPNMLAVINDRMNQMRNRIRNLSGEKNKQIDTSYIRGTFDRMIALENDYLNFFAPGDQIFDSIVNNAINSYKGTCTAISTYAGFNWNGFVFNWKIELDESLIYENNINPHIIDEYRGYLPRDFVTNIYNLNMSDALNDKALQFYKKLSSDRMLQSKVTHLGKRSNSNYISFKKSHSLRDWHDIVDEAVKEAKSNAMEEIKKKYSIALKNIKEELTDSYNASIFANKFYTSDSENEDLKIINDLIFEIMKKVRIVVDSICYLELNDGN